MTAQPFLPLALGPWVSVRDGDPSARWLFRRHYSWKPYHDGRDPTLFVGPGEKMVLLTPDARGLFIWRRFNSADGQQGVNCAVFRNETGLLSSALIRDAMHLVWLRWPGERLFTYVNPRRVRSSNPGYCFLAAGWQPVGYTKWNRLRILACASSTPALEAAATQN